MSKVCKHHAKHPVKIYSQCIGCELEMLHSENERQKAENVRLVAVAGAGYEKLVDALRWYADRDNYRGYYTAGGYWKSPANDEMGQRARDVLVKLGLGGERDART